MVRRSLLSLAVGIALVVAAVAIGAASVPLNDWRITGPFGGTATTVALDPEHPSVLLAGGMNSVVFRSRDYGADWELLNFPKRNLSEVTSILVDAADSKHYLAGMIAAQGGGLFESHDEGQTWTAVKDLQDVGVRSLAASPSSASRFVAGTVRGVMLSDDSGKTWTRISDPQNPEMQAVSAVAIDTKDSNIIYAGTSHLPWKTMDGGKTWQSIHTGMIDDSDVFSIYVDPHSPNDVLASACSGIYASSDRGDLWHKLMGIPNSSRRTHVIREDPSGENILYAGTTTGLFKSLNRGITWKSLTNTPVNALAFDPSRPGGLYLAMQDEGLGKSNDGGEAIDMINNGFVDRSVNAVTRSGDRLIALEMQNGETSGIFASSDQGDSWTQLRNLHGLAGVHLKAITGMLGNDRILLAASSHQVYKSMDAGLSWRPVPVRLIVTVPPPAQKPQKKTSARTSQRTGQTAHVRASLPAKPRVIIREISPSEITALYSMRTASKELLLAATDLGLLKSADAGEHWTLADIPGSMAVTGVYSTPNFDSYIIARTPGALYISKDQGDHWEQVHIPLPISDINDIAVSANQNHPLLVATRVGLYSSPDYGSTWYANPAGLPPSTVASVIYAGPERTAYAVEYGQLYQSNDAGTSWELAPSALPSMRIRQLWLAHNNSNRVFGITSDMGILFRN
jgi:photosystem II stability/assembly factor-like uncharacterized protein